MSSRAREKLILENRLTLRGAVMGAGIFLALGVFLAAGGHGRGVKKKVKPLDPAYYDPTPMRKVKKALLFEGAACADCHEDVNPKDPIDLSEDPVGKGEFHEKVILEHGKNHRNNRCFNCHNRFKPGFFADDAGKPIPYNEVQLLCSKCHGLLFQDWEGGAHGRRNGFWDKSRGKQTALVCIACHDPHKPQFQGPALAPGPKRLHPEAAEPEGHP